MNKDQQYTKESITKLADEAKTQINQNKYLLEIIEIFNNQISMVKGLITNYSLNAHQNNNSNNNLPLKYKDQLSLLNSKLKEEINKNIKKQESMLNNISQDLLGANQTLSQFSIDNFILNNTIYKYDSRIKTLNEQVDSSKKYDLFREPKRESEIEIKESKNIFLVYNLECQQRMLSFCRAYANHKFKNFKKEIKINKIKKNLALLKKIIKYYCNKIYGDETKVLNIFNEKVENNKNGNAEGGTRNVDIKKRIGTTPHYKKQFEQMEKNKKFSENKFISINENMEENNDNNNNNNIKEEKNQNDINDTSFNKTSFFNDNDISLFKNINTDEYDNNKNKTAEKNNERKKINILNIDELLDIENINVEDEEIIENELNSDDEVYFEKKIKPKKKIKTDFLPILKKDVPSINLSQIEFNKLKVINEADAYSLQKRKLEQGNINGKIKNIKKQIKNLEKKIGINLKKLNVIHNFIEDVKYNYKLLRPIKVQTSAAGNPVHYIREKLLNIVEETITQSEKKGNTENDKYKTGKTAVDEGEDYEDQVVGSDYSEEDEYIDSYENKYYNSENKENENENNNIINLEGNNKIYKYKQKKNKIKTNLISKFESNQKDEEEEKKKNQNQNEIYDDLNNNILGNTSAQSK